MLDHEHEESIIESQDFHFYFPKLT